MRRVTFFLLPLVLLSVPVFSFTGEVIGVLDGDTLDVLHNRRAERIRLHGIDFPEQGQPDGNTARQATSAWALVGS